MKNIRFIANQLDSYWLMANNTTCQCYNNWLIDEYNLSVIKMVQVVSPVNYITYCITSSVSIQIFICYNTVEKANKDLI
jgi:hypothetical protein